MFSFTGSSKETSLAAAREVGVATDGLAATQGTNFLAENIGRDLATALSMLGDILTVLHLDKNARIDTRLISEGFRGDKTVIFIR